MVSGRSPTIAAFASWSASTGRRRSSAGALTVLIVVTALDLLNRGDSTVGLLNAAMGIGGLIGALAAFTLIGRKRLASDFGLGIVLWGAPLAAIGIWPTAGSRSSPSPCSGSATRSSTSPA